MLCSNSWLYLAQYVNASMFSYKIYRPSSKNIPTNRWFWCIEDVVYAKCKFRAQFSLQLSLSMSASSVSKNITDVVSKVTP